MMIQAASYTLSLREREGTHFSGRVRALRPSTMPSTLAMLDPLPQGEGLWRTHE